jgi:hypothetical protein
MRSGGTICKFFNDKKSDKEYNKYFNITSSFSKKYYREVSIDSKIIFYDCPYIITYSWIIGIFNGLFLLYSNIIIFILIYPIEISLY